MRRLFFCLLLITSTSARAEIAFSPADGTSAQTAIVVTGATSISNALPAEQAWVSQHHPGCEPKGAAFTDAPKNGKTYQIVGAKCATGTISVWFDITAFADRYR